MFPLLPKQSGIGAVIEKRPDRCLRFCFGQADAVSLRHHQKRCHGDFTEGPEFSRRRNHQRLLKQRGEPEFGQARIAAKRLAYGHFDFGKVQHRFIDIEKQNAGSLSIVHILLHRGLAGRVLQNRAGKNRIPDSLQSRQTAIFYECINFSSIRV